MYFQAPVGQMKPTSQTLEEKYIHFFVVNEANSSPGILAIRPRHPAVETVTESQR